MVRMEVKAIGVEESKDLKYPDVHLRFSPLGEGLVKVEVLNIISGVNIMLGDKIRESQSKVTTVSSFYLNVEEIRWVYESAKSAEDYAISEE